MGTKVVERGHEKSCSRSTYLRRQSQDTLHDGVWATRNHRAWSTDMVMALVFVFFTLRPGLAARMDGIYTPDRLSRWAEFALKKDD